MSNALENDNYKTEAEDEETISLTCPHCNADLMKVGVIEAITGYSEARIRVTKNNKIEIGSTEIKDITEQYGLCGSCREELPYTAVEYIDAFTEVIES